MAKEKVTVSKEEVEQVMKMDNAPARVNEMAHYREDAMDGSEFGKDDVALPFIRVLQEKCPQVSPRDPKFIDRAEAGMIFNTVTGKLYRESTNLETRKPDTKFPGVITIPVAYTPSCIEWKPDRGGFARDHGSDFSILKQTSKGGKNGNDDVLPNGNTIVRAGLYYVFLVDAVTGQVAEAAFSLSSTGLTVSKRWNSTIKDVRFTDGQGSFRPAMYAMSYYVGTFWDTEHSGGDFFNYSIRTFKKTEELPNGMQILAAARSFKKLIESGDVKTVKEQPDNTKDEIPF